MSSFIDSPRRTVMQDPIIPARRPRRVLPRSLEHARTSVRAAWRMGIIADVVLLGGWFAASYWVSQFFPRVWPLAIAILCFAVGGIRFAGNLAWHGFYALWLRGREPRR